MPQNATIAPRFGTLIALSGLSVLSLNMFLPSLSNIATDFSASWTLVNLSIAGYAAATAILQLIVGPLSDRFGRRPVMLAALVVFCLASFGCLLATDIRTFLLCRMMQAAIVAGYTVSLAVVRDTAGAQRAASLIGYLAMAWAIAPMLGPVLGGLLDELYGWRASFWAFSGFGVVVLTVCWIDLRETNRTPSRTLKAQFRAYPELARSRRFWGYALCMAFSTGAFYAFLGGAPVVASALFDVPPGLLGVYMGSITAGFVFGSFLSGRFAARYPLSAMMTAGRIVACAGLLLGLLVLATGFVHELTVFGACVCVGIGNGVTMPSSSSGALSVRPALAGSASGLTGALAVAGGALVSAATGAILTAENAALALLGMMLISSALGLAAALYMLWLDRSEARLASSTS
ncbi:MAG: multidrug effflux MFS transporter [Rhodospirillaceae bacterium]|nr:multidrug effflux MFS transporter [Rhodospirillaceae bacterium]MYB12606.1 multidrug effflux MFS transporter [Rhodospirillaceae bacterium]MYI50573.1 multidrug effflux MFS transporter [Rhodospirillaceae bacterium]